MTTCSGTSVIAEARSETLPEPCAVIDLVNLLHSVRRDCELARGCLSLSAHERCHADLKCHRTRRSACGRAASAVGIRRAAAAGGSEDTPGKARSNPAGDGLGP